MIKAEIKKTVYTATEKYAILNDVDPTNVQVFITDQQPESDKLTYQIAIGWQPGETVSFLDLRNKKFDLLPIETISTPVIRNSIKEIAESKKVELSEIGVFMYRHNECVALAIFIGKESIRTLTLSKYLQELGLE